MFRALRQQGISSWRCYKTSVFTWFWAPGGGPGRKNWLRSFQHRRPKHGSNIAPKMAHRANLGQHAQHRPNLGQYRAKMGPMAQHGPDLVQHTPKMGPRWLNMGPTWPNMGTTCAQHRPRLLAYRQALRIMPASVQPLNPGAGHGARVLAGGLRW